MSRIWFCILFAFIIVSTASAQSIHLLDLQKVVSQSKLGRSKQEALKKEFDGIKAELDKKEAEVRRAQEDFVKQASVLSEEATRKRRDEIGQLEQVFRAEVEKREADFRAKNKATLEEIVSKIRQLVGQLSEKNDYPFVLEKNPGVVLYAKENLDITEEVLKAFDLANPK